MRRFGDLQHAVVISPILVAKAVPPDSCSFVLFFFLFLRRKQSAWFSAFQRGKRKFLSNLKCFWSGFLALASLETVDLGFPTKGDKNSEGDAFTKGARMDCDEN